MLVCKFQHVSWSPIANYQLRRTKFDYIIVVCVNQQHNNCCTLLNHMIMLVRRNAVMAWSQHSFSPCLHCGCCYMQETPCPTPPCRPPPPSSSPKTTPQTLHVGGPHLPTIFSLCLAFLSLSTPPTPPSVSPSPHTLPTLCFFSSYYTLSHSYFYPCLIHTDLLCLRTLGQRWIDQVLRWS